jgi:hypothetical protein
MRRILSSIFVVSVFSAALLVSGCGDSHTKVVTGTYAGESGLNAPYLDVGPLIYEVQLSRQLNPYDTEDSAYLQGLSAKQRHLATGEEWFAVFLQVFNHSSHALPAARSLTISDTQGDTYSPLLPTQANPFVYRAGMVPAKERLPQPNSIAAAGATQGALLLYKIKVLSLDNRPLKIQIVDPSDPARSATAELDV